MTVSDKPRVVPGFEHELADTPVVIPVVIFLASPLVVLLLLDGVSGRPLVNAVIAHAAQFAVTLYWLASIPRGQHSPSALLGQSLSPRIGGLIAGGLVSGFCIKVALVLTESRVRDAASQDLPELGELTLPVALYKLVFFVCLGPIVEELVFRGVLFRKWRARHGAVRGLLFSTLLFALGHPGQLASTAFAGFILALLYTRTRTLWAPIAMHALSNAVVFAIEASLASVPALTRAASEVTFSWWIVVVGFALGLPWTIWFVHSSWPTANAPLPPAPAGSAA